jgi:hypothetical protein
MYVHYDREQILKFKLNTFLQQRLALPAADYYSQLDQKAFLEFKSVLSDINNIFTLKVTMAFINWLSEKFAFDPVARQKITASILGTPPNANGYDVEILTPLQIIAEVKCNIPINDGDTYGSAQRDGIAKDVKSLIEGKSKSGIDPTACFKFMVLLDTPEIRKATDHFIRNMKQDRERVVAVESATKLDEKERVYVVYVRF